MASRSGASKSKRPSTSGARAQRVWLCLLASMTGVGALLMGLDRKPAPRMDGATLPPLVVASSDSGIESIFRVRVPLARDRWTSIMIHHSGSMLGNPETIATQHQGLGFKGLGHHFIIGNGAGMDDGELHVGYRWLEQLPGAHAAGPDGDLHNRQSISICLVGDGNRQPFTKAQLRRLVLLVHALCDELDVPPERVLLHGETAKVADPGANFPAEWFRRRLVGG
ncbi:MAG: N-acetylmuramoyl-L-alanine amidase [Phycisphaerae bacterium]|nr:N-acetylmuramoyl-L-alanine amidase [Phycisphaerae bacterium]